MFQAEMVAPTARANTSAMVPSSGQKTYLQTWAIFGGNVGNLW